MMELKIYNPTEDGFMKAIEWNHEEIKAEVAEKVKLYTSLVYSEDQIKEAKADRAKLNKFVQALETKRKEIKKKCMQPYEDFERKVKEIIAIVNEPIMLIDNQVKGYEEKKKEEKAVQIKAFFEGQPKIEDFEELKIEQIWDPKWLNATVSFSKVSEEIHNKIVSIHNQLAMLKQLPEFSFEAVTVYKETLDVTRAVNEAKRMSDIQKAKAEAEAKRRAEEEMAKATVDETAQEPTLLDELDQAQGQSEEVVKAEVIQEEIKEWISFKACMTVSQARELKAFFESRNIEFKAI